MKALSYRLYYFLGIGGIGMSALARFFHHYGKRVHGYDRTETDLTRQLTEEGISCYYDENVSRLEKILSAFRKEEVLVIFTPAVPVDNEELLYLRKQGYALMKRAEMLGAISDAFRTVAIAGTHGKTTTTTLVTHLLRNAGINCFSFMGGISKNYGTNILLGDLHDRDAIMVAEADEYDRSFLHLHPSYAVITSVDADHLDIYGDASHVKEGYALFARCVRKGGTLVVKKSVDNELALNVPRHVYSLNLDTEYRAEGVTVHDGRFVFDVVGPTATIRRATLGLPGLHNVENAVAAVAIAMQMGIDPDAIRDGLRSFKGVRRRFDYRVHTRSVVYIDDYAHHPEELRATIASARMLFPAKRITGIFQPHLYSRTRDFADAFAASLDALDECFLLEIYPAREKPIDGVTSAMLLRKMKMKEKRLVSKEELLATLQSDTREVVITMGAGDIDRLVEPIEKILSEKAQQK